MSPRNVQRYLRIGEDEESLQCREQGGVQSRQVLPTQEVKRIGRPRRYARTQPPKNPGVALQELETAEGPAPAGSAHEPEDQEEKQAGRLHHHLEQKQEVMKQQQLKRMDLIKQGIDLEQASAVNLEYLNQISQRLAVDAEFCSMLLINQEQRDNEESQEDIRNQIILLFQTSLKEMECIIGGHEPQKSIKGDSSLAILEMLSKLILQAIQLLVQVDHSLGEMIDAVWRLMLFAYQQSYKCFQENAERMRESIYLELEEQMRKVESEKQSLQREYDLLYQNQLKQGNWRLCLARMSKEYEASVYKLEQDLQSVRQDFQLYKVQIEEMRNFEMSDQFMVSINQDLQENKEIIQKISNAVNDVSSVRSIPKRDQQIAQSLKSFVNFYKTSQLEESVLTIQKVLKDYGLGSLHPSFTANIGLINLTNPATPYLFYYQLNTDRNYGQEEFAISSPLDFLIDWFHSEVDNHSDYQQDKHPDNLKNQQFQAVFNKIRTHLSASYSFIQLTNDTPVCRLLTYLTDKVNAKSNQCSDQEFAFLVGYQLHQILHYLTAQIRTNPTEVEKMNRKSQCLVQQAIFFGYAFNLIKDHFTLDADFKLFLDYYNSLTLCSSTTYHEKDEIRYNKLMWQPSIVQSLANDLVNIFKFTQYEAEKVLKNENIASIFVKCYQHIIKARKQENLNIESKFITSPDGEKNNVQKIQVESLINVVFNAKKKHAKICFQNLELVILSNYQKFLRFQSSSIKKMKFKVDNSKLTEENWQQFLEETLAYVDEILSLYPFLLCSQFLDFSAKGKIKAQLAESDKLLNELRTVIDNSCQPTGGISFHKVVKKLMQK